MKKLLMIGVCLFGGSLCAETIGHVQFEFPPSEDVWALYASYDSDDASNDGMCPWTSDESDDDDEDCDDDGDTGHFRCDTYMRSEGGSPSFFMAVLVDHEASDASDGQDEMQNPEFLESMISQVFLASFPNYQFSAKKVEGQESSWFIEWNVHDGVQNVVQGITRGLDVTSTESVALSYAVQGTMSEADKVLWLNMLTQAKPSL